MKVKITKTSNKANLNKVIEIIGNKTTLRGKEYRVEYSEGFGRKEIHLFLNNSKQSTPNPITIWSWEIL